MNIYAYCRVGRSEQLQNSTSCLKVLNQNKNSITVDEINRILRNGISYPTNIMQLLDRKE